jgi:hypothetical protein
MSENPTEPSVIGALPHSRPHRRSEKRAARPGSSSVRGTAESPAPEPLAPEQSTPEPDTPDLLSTAVHALAELAEIGLTAGARALRIAVSRLPHP